jgi:hypothetical protein
VTFTRLLLVQFNFIIIFGGDILKSFNIRQHYPHLIAITGNQTTSIAFNFNCGYSFEICDRVQLFLHASFLDAKYNHVCKNNESYYKLTKQYPLLDDDFDAWFSPNDTRLTTPEIDFFVLELTFKDDLKLRFIIYLFLLE